MGRVPASGTRCRSLWRTARAGSDSPTPWSDLGGTRRSRGGSASVASIEADLAKAEAKGDAKAAEAARGRLAAQQEWLTLARAGLDEFGG